MPEKKKDTKFKPGNKLGHRFKKGKSGNPAGQSKLAKERLAYKKVFETIGSAAVPDELLAPEVQDILEAQGIDPTVTNVVITSLAVQAVYGDTKAAKLYLDHLFGSPAKKIQKEVKKLVAFAFTSVPPKTMVSDVLE